MKLSFHSRLVNFNLILYIESPKNFRKWTRPSRGKEFNFLSNWVNKIL